MALENLPGSWKQVISSETVLLERDELGCQPVGLQWSLSALGCEHHQLLSVCVIWISQSLLSVNTLLSIFIFYRIFKFLKNILMQPSWQDLYCIYETKTNEITLSAALWVNKIFRQFPVDKLSHKLSQLSTLLWAVISCNFILSILLLDIRHIDTC